MLFSFFHGRSKWICTTLLVIQMLAPSGLHAAGIRMEPHLGYNGFFPLERWIPLNVILENSGQTTNGVLEVIATSGSEYHRNIHATTYRQRVSLPTNARKQYSFTIWLDSFVHPLVLRLRRGDTTYLRREMDLRNNYTTERMALVVGQRVSLDFLSLFPRGIKPVYPRPEFLPRDWFGYDGVDLLIVQGPTLQKLGERQFEALRKWVERGGFCVISGHLNFSAYMDARLRELLPVRVQGLKKISNLDPLETFCRARLPSSGPFLVLVSRPEQGKIVVGREDLPLIVSREVGYGRVVFLAFDYEIAPFNEWEGRHTLWKKLLDMRPAGKHPTGFLERRMWIEAMISKTAIRFPSHGALMGFMVLYLLVVYLIFRLLKRNRTARRGALLLAGSAILFFTFASYTLFLFHPLRQDPVVDGFAHMVMRGSERMATARMLVGIYSVKGGEHRISFQGPRQPLLPAPWRPSNPDQVYDYVLDQEDLRQQIVMTLPRWSARFFELETKMDFPLNGESSVEDGALLVSLENLTSAKIMDCWLYYADRLFRVGAIGPDERNAARFPARLTRSRGKPAMEVVERLGEEMLPSLRGTAGVRGSVEIMKELLKTISSRYSSRKDVAVLTGWVDISVLPTRIMGYNQMMRKFALLSLIMPVREHHSGNAALDDHGENAGALHIFPGATGKWRHRVG